MNYAKFLGAISAAISLILITVINIALISTQYRAFRRHESQAVHGLHEDNPHLGRLPGHFQEVAMTFQENQNFSLIDDDKWARFFPTWRGYVRLGPKGRSFVVSLYHQFHCVNAIRFAYTVARDGLVTDPEVLSSELEHDNHCFQFLRQSILCRADDALVPLSRANASVSYAGFGVTHRCQNWKHIKESVDEYTDKWEGVPYLKERR